MRIVTLHCSKCLQAFFHMDIQQYNPNDTEYIVYKNETSNLKILFHSLVTCKTCTTILGQKQNNNLLVINKRSVITFINN